MTKISQLSPASTPLTGSEQLLTLQGTTDAKATVGVAKVLPGFGDLPTNRPIGSMGFIIDGVGGRYPAFWDGTQWRRAGAGRGIVNITGIGTWVVGIGISTGVTNYAWLDRGFYFVSDDGFNWRGLQNPNVNLGYSGICYANGCFLAGGHTTLFGGTRAILTTTTEPRDSQEWRLQEPFAYVGPQGSSPAPTGILYNNEFSRFAVPVTGDGTQILKNPFSGALVPDENWPWIGANGLDEPIQGMGTAGAVEVRINSKDIIITRFSGSRTFPVVSAGLAGVYTSHFLEARKIGGGGDWDAVLEVSTISGGINPDVVNEFNREETDPFGRQALPNPQNAILGGNSFLAAGMVLRGLVWGPIKQTSVRFLRGQT